MASTHQGGDKAHQRLSFDVLFDHVPTIGARLKALTQPTAACLSLVVTGQGMVESMKLTAIQTLQGVTVQQRLSNDCGQLPTSSFFFEALKALVLEAARKLALRNVTHFRYTSAWLGDTLYSWEAAWQAPDRLEIEWTLEEDRDGFDVSFNTEAGRVSQTFINEQGRYEAVHEDESLRSFELKLQQSFLPDCWKPRRWGELVIGERTLRASLCTTLKEESRTGAVRVYAPPRGAALALLSRTARLQRGAHSPTES